MNGVADANELDALAARIDSWLTDFQAENPLVRALDRDETGERRWFVRLAGEERDHTTIWLHLRQRTLSHETYVLPAPVDSIAEFYEFLMRRNHGLHGIAFSIGPEDAVYLVGELPHAGLERAAVDHILGLHYEAVEKYFRPALRLGFASMLPPNKKP